MTSPTDSTSGKKKRPGRKRLPPLAPGPRLQFVVASHPDDFKADKTMRNIRSHVMYKHRSAEGRGASPSGRHGSVERTTRAGSTTRTPSPMTAADGYLDAGRPPSTLWDGDYYAPLSESSRMGPVRSLAAKILSATEQTQSAPPAFDEGGEYPFASSSAGIFAGGPEDALKGPYLDLSSDFYGGKGPQCSLIPLTKF
jgi:hypothetical protein